MIRPLLLSGIALVVVGCSGGAPGSPGAHTAKEEAAMKEAKSLTPQQQLERAEANTTLSASEKESLIKSIKEKNGL